MTKLLLRCFMLLAGIMTFLSTPILAQTGVSPCFGDTTKPHFEHCPETITLTALDTCAVAQWQNPVASDNCGIRTLTNTHQSGACFNVGITSVIYTATDSAGNSKSCEFRVVVNHLTVDSICATDTIKPRFTFCPNNIVLTTMDSCAHAQWEKPVAVDNCSAPSVIGNFTPGTCFRVGVTQVGYAATDAKGNRSYCTFTVTIKRPNLDSICATDTVKPRFTFCPDNIVLISNDTCVHPQWNRPIAIDNCAPPSVTSNLTAGACIPLGITNVVYVATDANGNKNSCAFTITVKRPSVDSLCATDTIKPRFTSCPQNITVSGLDSCMRVTWATPIAIDNCSTPSVTSNYTPNTCFRAGATGVVYTATDVKGNVAICTFVVNVNNPCLFDTIKPRFERCPRNIVLTSTDSCVRTTWTAPLASDNCSTPSVSSNYAPGTCFKLGLTDVVYKATDAKGNSSVCSFSVTVVNPCANDTIKPRFTSCPTNIVVNSLDSCAKVRWNTPLATDNCSTPVVKSNYSSGDCFVAGTTPVRYSAIDAKGNVSLCSFTVTVNNPCANDTIKPTFFNCPANIVKGTPDTATTVSWREPTAIDNCGVKNQTVDIKSGSKFNLGTTTVTYSATDAKGNTGYCTFTVMVKQVITPCSNDTVAPVFSNCPANIVDTTASLSAIGQWTPPTATDNCSTPSVSSNYKPGSSFPIGTTTVLYQAKDSKNNFSYCSFTVTVVKRPLVLDTLQCYVLVARSSKKVLSIGYASTDAGANAVQWTYQNGLNQKWGIKAADSNSVNLTVKHTDMNLDTRWGSTANGARLMQWAKSNSLSQKWQLVPLTDGYFKVINKASGRALSIGGGPTATTDGSLLYQLDYAGLTSQQWSIEAVPCASAAIPPARRNFVSNDVLEMNAQPELNRARIEWVNNTGYKNDFYEVEKMNNTTGKFESLTIVNNTSFDDQPTAQTVYDNTPVEGDNFYRVKVYYLDSLSKTSAVTKLTFSNLQEVKVFPNPADDYVDIDLSTYKNEPVGVYLYNSFGQRVAFQNLQKGNASTVHFDITGQSAGQYLVRITAQGKRDVTKLLNIIR